MFLLYTRIYDGAHINRNSKVLNYKLMVMLFHVCYIDKYVCTKLANFGNGGEESNGILQALDEGIHFVCCVVEVQACSCTCTDTQVPMQGLCAMVTRSNSNPMLRYKYH